MIIATTESARRSLAIGILSALLLGFGAAALAAEPQSPDDVHTALKILASVYADMQSKLPNQLDRLPHENGEFQDGSGAMRDAMAKEPTAYRTKVLAALTIADKDAQQVADASQTHDVTQVQTALHRLADSMRALNGLFPVALRAEPGSMPPPHHRTAS